MITVTVDDREVQILNTAVQRRFSPVSREAFFREKISPYYRNQFALAFAQHGRKTKWKPLSPATIESRIKKHGETVWPLRETNELFVLVNTFSGQTASSANNTTFIVPGYDEVSAGGETHLNPSGKYKWHQTGFMHRSGQWIAPRPMVEIAGEDRVAIQNLAFEHFLGRKFV